MSVIRHAQRNFVSEALTFSLFIGLSFGSNGLDVLMVQVGCIAMCVLRLTTNCAKCTVERRSGVD